MGHSPFLDTLTGEVVHDWSHWLAAALLVLMRLSGLVAFAPIFSSAAIAPRIKASFVIAMTILLAPPAAAVPFAHADLTATTIFGELGVGLLFGLSLKLMIETLEFAGTLLGIEFSFSLVNLLDPNSLVETPVLGQLLNWLGILVLLSFGFDRSMLAALMRSFRSVPVGTAMLHAESGMAIASMASGVFLAGLQLASPVVAAGIAVEITVSLISRLAPQLPAMIISIPLKTIASYIVLLGSLAIWPGWIERHFIALLDMAGRLIGAA